MTVTNEKTPRAEQSSASQPPTDTPASARGNEPSGFTTGHFAILCILILLGVIMFWLGWGNVTDHSITPSEYIKDVYLPERGGNVKSVLIDYTRRHPGIPEGVDDVAVEIWINGHVQWEVRDVIWRKGQLRPQGMFAPTKDVEDFGWFHNYGDYKVASVPVIARGSGPLAGYGMLLLDAQVDIFLEAEEGRDGGPRADPGTDANLVVDMTLNEKRSFSSIAAR